MTSLLACRRYLISPTCTTASCIWAEITPRSSASNAVSFSTIGSASEAYQSLDIGAAILQLLLERFETAVEMIDPVQHGLALGRQRRNDEGNRRSEIGRHHRRAGQLPHPSDL